MRLEITAHSSAEEDVSYVENCVDEILQLLTERGFSVQSCATSAGNMTRTVTPYEVGSQIIDVEYEDIKEDTNNEGIK